MSVRRRWPGAAAALTLAGAAALLAIPLPASPIAAQQGAPAPPPRRTFSLLAFADFAGTGMRASGAQRFWVSNAGPMDAQQTLLGIPGPARVTRANGTFTQFAEVTLFAAAAPGDWAANRGRVPSLANVTGGGAALSYNYHLNAPGTTMWTARDGSLGFNHRGVRSTADNSCLNHTVSNIPAGAVLMAASDCPGTWGLRGFEGRRPVPLASYRSLFAANRNGFRFNFFDVPPELTDTTLFLGDRFQTYGLANDYGRERLVAFGNVIPGGTGAPREQGYPMGLEWRFDAFTLNALPGVVFWQATITNRSREVYGGTGLDYDSLYAGILARHVRQNRSRAGFDVPRGTAVFNEIQARANCDAARAVPGSFSFGGYTGNCAGSVGFTNGVSSITFLKSPIGDLRFKQFSDSSSAFSNPTSPVRGDTITFNIGRLCGDDCILDRFASPQTGWGVIAAREAAALGNQAAGTLDPFQYWQLFHPVNNAPYGDGPRVDLSNPRAGGGFNFAVPGWRYSTRPAGAPAAGSDTLFLDTCNPVANRCNPIWADTLPGQSIDFTRGATWVGAGPFRLPADSTASLILAIAAHTDSAAAEQTIAQTIALYQTFFVAPAQPPAPRVTAVRVTPGSTRQTLVEIYLDNRTVGYVDPFVQSVSERFRAAGLPRSSTPGGPPNCALATSVEQRLNCFNPGLGAPAARRTLADSVLTLAAANIGQILVFKSCDNGRNFTSGSSPNLCTRDVIKDSLGVERGPAAYRTIPAGEVRFTDGNVLGGQSYYYAFVPVTRGVRLQLLDSTATTGRRVIDTTLVAATSALPATASAPNVAVVYVPASLQAGTARSAVRFTRESGPRTLNPTSDTTFTGLTVTALDTLQAPVAYRLVFGDTVVVKEYSTNALIDSTVVIVRRSAPVGFTFTAATTASSTATPRRVRTDSLVFVRRERTPLPIVAATGTIGAAGAAGQPADTVVGTRRIRTTLLFGTVGGFVNTGTAAIFTGTGTAPFTGLLGQAVLIEEQGGAAVPIAVGNDLRNLAPAASFVVNSRVLSSPGFGGVNVDIQNRPVLTAAAGGGAQRVDQFYADPKFGRLLGLGGIADRPTVDWQGTPSRLLGTSVGEIVATFLGSEWGPLAPFNFSRGLGPLQAQVDSSLARRPTGQTTDTSQAVIDAVNAALKPTAAPAARITSDSLLAVKLPFTIRNASADRPIIVAQLRSDKYATYLLGAAPDSGRVVIPADVWVPGERLIFLQNVAVADTAGGAVRRDASGNVLTRDVLTVVAYPAVIGCAAAFPFTCNPLVGRGGTAGYITADSLVELHIRYAVPFTSEREFAFTVSPLMTGARLTSRPSQSQLDSVKVVPNPYVIYSNYEQTATNEQRVAFTHLPPQGTIRIYTAAGQFVQELRWTPAQLNGSGDLYFNLISREGTELASGLYLFTVTAADESGSTKRRKVGRFIIIR